MIKVILNINKTSDYIKVWWRLVTYKRRWYIIGKNVIGSRQNDNNHVISNIMIWSKTLQEKYRKTSHINMHSTKKPNSTPIIPFYYNYSTLSCPFNATPLIPHYPTHATIPNPFRYIPLNQVNPTNFTLID